MGKRTNLILAGMLATSLFSTSAFAETIIKDANGIEYLANQIIVKIKSVRAKGVENSVDKPRRVIGLAEAPSSVRSLMAKWNVTESKALFPQIVPPTEKMNLSAAKRAAKQREFEKLGNTFVVKFPPGTDVRAAVTDFKSDPEVEYAEPVYVFRLCMIPNDPLFNQQWYLHNTGQYYLEDADIDAPEAWEINQGSANPVIAIIDTGVDLDHPDLVNQIWENASEQSGDGNGDGKPGWAGFDDDGDGLIDEDSQGRQPGEPGYNNDLVNDDDENGYNDDFIGWNWIDDHNNPQDDHGHGTHCAGIAAADTNNSIGIAGVCPNGQIMPLKAFQSSGSASNADIALAIEYAYQNGADVISMSFTLGADSALVRNALELAYSTTVLVAASGNLPQHSGVRYPAHYSYVIGVGATDVKWDSETSSYKEVIAGFTNTTNADIYAPGVSIRSTLLDDTYASWSGTSMATPIVAGIAGLLVSEKTGGFWGPDLYQGQILNSGEVTVKKKILTFSGPRIITGKRISSLMTLTRDPEPHLILESYTIDDSTGDNDGIPDANETIDLYFTIRSTYGNATGVAATLSTSDVMATVIDPCANYGNIGPSASDDNTGDPITVHISPDADNNRDIVFNFQADGNNGGTGIDKDIVLTVQRGVEISGVIDTNTVWTADNAYIVTGNILINSGVTLTIEPGTRVLFDSAKYIVIDGRLLAVGKSDNRIVFTSNATNPVPGSWGTIAFHNSTENSAISFAVVEYSGSNVLLWSTASYGSALWIYNSLVNIHHCIFSENIRAFNFGAGGGSPESGTRVHHNIILGDPLIMGDSDGARMEYNTITGILIKSSSGSSATSLFFNFNNLYGNIEASTSDSASDVNATNSYWFTTDANEIEKRIWDYYDTFTGGIVYFQPFLLEPSPNAPAVVSTVVTDPISPVGPGNLKIMAAFSRPMNTNIPPSVSFGASEPYTQHVVTDGNWVDPNTWQGTYPVTLFTGDGIQNIRVSGAKASDPNFWFEIPVDTRFGFEIDTAGLAGVNLQASGEAGRVDLYYNPVNEPDLAGYNVYRSDVSGGPYTKINPAVVVDANYSDYTAPPGITKYYVVTAVRTDFDESDYSDEASAAAQDGTPPEISHTAIVDRDIVGPPGITIQATITDPGTGVASATLYYKKTSETTYSSLAMNNPSGDLWSQNIPGAAITLEGIDYYITAEDNSAYSDTAYDGTVESPHHIIIYTETCGPLGVPAGPSSQSYCTTDVTIDINSNDAAGEVTVYRMEANAPNVNEPSLQRHWAIRGLEGSTFSADLIFSYTDADLASAGLDEGNLILRKSADGGHTYKAVHATTDPMGNTVETTYEQTSFSMWTVSEFVCGDFGFLAADLDKSCRVDLVDFAILAEQWLQAPGTPSADIAPQGGDGEVDFLDLDVVAEHWLEDSMP